MTSGSVTRNGMSRRTHRLPDMDTTGHAGDDTSHVCDPCPDGCSEPDLEDWPDGWSASVGRCSYHCGDHPISGDELFDVTPDGFTNERVLL